MFIKKRLTMTAVMLVTALLLSAGVGAAAQGAARETDPGESVGRVIVGTEPEVAVDYDENAKVVDVTGLDREGEELAQEHVDELEGKKVSVAVGELVKLMCSDDSFVASVGGEKGIVVRIELGSQLPDDDFEKDISDEAENAVKEQGAKAKIISISVGDYSLDLSGKSIIKPDKAGEIALAQDDESDGNEPQRKSYQLLDGVYQLRFLADGKVIQASVDALSGKIMKYAENVFGNVTGGGKKTEGTPADDMGAQPEAQPEANTVTSTDKGMTTKAAQKTNSGWGESTGDSWENWGESYGDSWENWGESYGDGWESWGESYGDSWENWGESYGDGWESWGESTGDSWENWGESTGDSWENWGESYGDGWESWGESTGDSWENWGEGTGDSWESWGESYGDGWESWGESYGDSWENWGEGVGDLFDHVFDF